MDYELEKTVLENSVDFCTKEIVEPVLRSVMSWIDMDSFAVFTPELADFFDEYLPGYFGSDHKKFIGEYFCFTLYGESLPIEMFKEIVIGEDGDEVDTDELKEKPMSNMFSGLNVYFSDNEESLKVYIEQESIRESRFHFDSVQEVIIIQIINYLNSNKK